MKIEKNTSLASNEEIRTAFLFAKPTGLKGSTKITIRGSEMKCWMYGSIRIEQNRIVGHVGANTIYPCIAHYDKTGRLANHGYLQYLIRDRTEDLIGFFAHELQHLRQSQRKNKARINGRVVRQETECDIAAIRAIRKYRKDLNLTSPIIIP